MGSKEALQRAKQVVAERYSVVGLVGHMEMSLQLMQTLVPQFLTGALDFYYNISECLFIISVLGFIKGSLNFNYNILEFVFIAYWGVLRDL